MIILNVLSYAPLFGGGMASHLSALGRLARKRGDTLLLAFPYPRDWHQELEGEPEILVLPSMRKPLQSNFRNALQRLCLGHEVDIVHLHFHFLLPAALALPPRNLACRVIYHWHNPPMALLSGATSPGWRSRIHRLASGWLARVVDQRVIDRHVSMSQEISGLLVDHGWTREEKIVLIRNGVSPLSNAPHGNISQKASGRLIIGTVSNFRPQKDHATLVRAFAQICDAGDDAELWLVGDGPTKDEIQRLVTTLGVSDRVRFTGTVPDPRPMYEAFDIFALATHYEGHALVVLEAMNHGLPIVATRTSSIPETIAHGENGLLVEPKDPTDLSDALRRLLRDPSLRFRLGARARQAVKTGHSVDDWAVEIVDLYRRELAV